MGDCFGKDRAWIELDIGALRHNVAALRALLPPGCALMPAVKADAYGHGAVLIARELNRLGVRAFCVASAREGAQLRGSGVEGEILVLGYTHPRLIPLLYRSRLTQTVLDASYAECLNQAGLPLEVQIKIDTGMHRLGERWTQIDALERIFACRNLHVAGAFTHLCADETTGEEDRAYTLAQARAFQNAVAALRKRGCRVPKVHALASYGLLNYPEIGGDYARTGIALYGVLSCASHAVPRAAALQPVLSLKTRVAQVQMLQPGERAGYDLRFTARRETRLAVLSIGYADGLPRSLSCGVGAVLLHGCRAPVVGRICMDQTLVDATEIPETAPGDEAVLIGNSGAEKITACDVAEAAGTISNEILSRLGARLERIAVAPESDQNTAAVNNSTARAMRQACF